MLHRVFRFKFHLWSVCVCADSRVTTPTPLFPPPLPSWRLLTTDPSQLREEDLPGDLQSLSWLTSVDVPRLQQMADSRGHSNGPSQGSLLEQQTGKVAGRRQCDIQNLIKLSDWMDQDYWILQVLCFFYPNRSRLLLLPQGNLLFVIL